MLGWGVVKVGAREEVPQIEETCLGWLCLSHSMFRLSPAEEAQTSPYREHRSHCPRAANTRRSLALPPIQLSQEKIHFPEFN